MKQPNILLIYTDQQRWDALGVAGNAEIRTPNLDALAAGGVSYGRHFVQCPVCMPSRMSLLTGQYPATLGIMENGIPLGYGVPTLPAMLRNYGYFSANIGKLHFLPHANRDHSKPHPDYGFDQLEISDEPGCYEDAYRAWVRSRAPGELDKISLGLPPAAAAWQQATGHRDGIKHPERLSGARIAAFPAREDLTHSAFVAERTIQFLRRNAGRTFFCVAGFYAPHEPWVVPQRFLDMYDPAKLSVPAFPPEMEERRRKLGLDDAALRRGKHGYYASVSEVDFHVGRILAAVSELGLDHDTIVVFTSDHGEWLGEHLLYGKGPPAEDCITRTPLVIRWPGRLAGGTRAGQIVEAVDVVPTLLEWAGIPRPPQLQGRLLPTRADEPGRQSAVSQYTGWRSLRTERYHYSVWQDGRETLFDLAADPCEYRNGWVRPATPARWASAGASCFVA